MTEELQAATIEVTSMHQNIAVELLEPHPDNRPLGLNEERIEQLAELMRQHGFLPNKALSVVQVDDKYRIIGGEHRFHAAKKAKLQSIPCTIYDWDEQEQLLFLITDNSQTEVKALEIGLNALRVVKKDSKKGLSAAAYAERTGFHQKSIKRYLQAAKVFQQVKEQSDSGVRLLDSVHILEEISKCQQSDWQWFHDLAVSKELSKRDCIEISKRIREYDSCCMESFDQVFDYLANKQTIAKESIKGRGTDYNKIIKVLQTLGEKIEELGGEIWELYKYNHLTKEIESFDYNPSSELIEYLSKLKESEVTSSKILEEYGNILQNKRTGTKEKADEIKSYYENEAHKEEAERIRIAKRAAREFKNGQWWQIEDHLLYCGDSSKEEFYTKLPKAKFAFADPPYNAGVDKWDYGFEWNHNWLTDVATYVTVTPGLWDIPNFWLRVGHQMPWGTEITAYITNSISSRGKFGYEVCNPVYLFSHESVMFGKQNLIKYENKTSKSEQIEETHKGKKSDELMTKLIELFTDESDLVIDPFLGSGTTLINCQNLNRRFIGAEIDENKFKYIVERFEDKFEVTAKRVFDL